MKKKVGLPPMLKKMLIAKALSRAGAAPMAAAPMGAPATPPMGMKKGGTFKDRAASTKSAAHPDGVAQRGKTKAQVFRKGGKC